MVLRGLLSMLVCFLGFLRELGWGAVPKVKRVKNHAPAKYCDACGLTFTKPLEWERHITGRRHKLELERYATPEALYLEFLQSAPNWAPLPDPLINAEVMQNVSRRWDYDELSTLGLRMRATCLHPSAMMDDLKPFQKARVWRYVRDAMGVGCYSEMAAIIAAVDADRGTGTALLDEAIAGPVEPEKEWRMINGRNRFVAKQPATAGQYRDQKTNLLKDQGFVRIKELFESFEAYKQAANFIVAADKQATVERVVELGAGHGLVGLLLAYRFPEKEFVLYDRQRRGIFDVFLRAFEGKGHVSPAVGKFAQGSEGRRVLPNIRFVEGDVEEAAVSVNANALVLCIHGCNEVNQIAIEMALKNQCVWLVMPCCIRKQMYLACDVLLENDDARHSVMCGALAHNYGAQYMSEIDRRITNRGIVIGGGVGGGQLTQEAVPEAEAEAVPSSGVPIKFRGNLPRLALS